jgi:tripartite-type tricarboxylate transporter receptor subunit TctC
MEVLMNNLLPVALVALATYGASLPALAQDSFYKGKTLRVVVATSAGGGFDAYTRTIARHLSKHIPGNPNILVENMPGAGHRIGANHLYKIARPDGLTLGHFQGGLFLAQVLGEQGIQFDALKYEFIGAPVKDNRACALTKASGITSMERWIQRHGRDPAGGGQRRDRRRLLDVGFDQSDMGRRDSPGRRDRRAPDS